MFRSKKCKRFTSLLLSIMLIVMMVPTNIFAAEKTSDIQIEKHDNGNTQYYGYSEDGFTKLAYDKDNENAINQTQHGKVKVSKTIEGTSRENEFQINLEVQTSNDVIESASAPDAAVILVIDISGSMKYRNCKENDKYYKKDTEGKCKNCDKEEKDHLEERLIGAKNAAEEFINSYKNTTLGAKRMISVVTFAVNAHRLVEWTDVSKEDNAKTVIDKIKSIKSSGGTNIEAGLQLGKNRLAMDIVSKGESKIDNKFMILLSDGAPNRVIDGERTSTESLKGEKPKDKNSAKAAINVGKAILDTDQTKLYSISYATADAKVETFLLEFSTKVFKAKDASELKLQFEAIIKQINMITKAWTVVDPMGDHMEFKKFMNQDGAVKFDSESNTLHWDIKQDLPKKGEGTVNDPYVYKIAYQVSLKNATSDLGDKYYNTNGRTILNYVFNDANGNLLDENGNSIYNSDGKLNDGSDKVETLRTIDFNVPAVKSLYGKLIFDKVAYGENLPGATFSLGSAEGWSASATSDTSGKVTFNKIPSGYEYQIKETSAPDGYTVSEVTKNIAVSFGEIKYDGKKVNDGNSAFTFENVSEEKYIEFPVTKTWIDGGRTTRPSIVIELMQYEGESTSGKVFRTATLTAANAVNGEPTKWEYKFTDLPEFNVSNKVPYRYEAIERSVEGYDVSYHSQGQQIINRLNSTTNIEVMKTWVDDQNNHPDVELELLANGKEMNPAMTVTLTNGKTSHTFESLPLYGQTGPITYTVRENTVLTNYSTEYSENGLNVTNRINQEYTSVEITKEWLDNQNEYKTRPESITVSLLADGAQKREITLNEANGWKEKVDKLPVYKTDGEKVNGERIVYTIKEQPLAELEDGDKYVSTVNGFTITNTLTGTTSLSGTKQWIVPDGFSDYPAVEVKLNTGETTMLRDDRFEFTNLPKYTASGVKIEYSVSEYIIGENSTNFEKNINETNLVNTYNEKVTVSGTKTWNDNKNSYNTRPESITVELFADGESIDTTTVNEEGGWNYSFTGLDKYRTEEVIVEAAKVVSYPEVKDDEGNVIEEARSEQIPAVVKEELVEIKYTIKEEDVNNYKATYDENFNIVNTLTGTTSISGTKVWEDNNNAYGTRPEYIEVKLYKNGGDVAIQTQTIKVTSYSFDNLPKYDDLGVEIQYTVGEEPVDNYSTSINGTVITNTLNQQFTTFPVTKTWVDGGRGEHPTITVNLYQICNEGEKPINSVTMANGTTQHTFHTDETGEELPVFKFENGKVVGKYSYAVTEDKVEGYTTSINGGSITNTSDTIKDKIDITITKQWLAPKDYALPEATFTVYRNGVFYKDVFSSDMEYDQVKGIYTYTIEDLPLYSEDGNTTYTYTAEEKVVPEDFTSTKDGFNFVNTIDEGSVVLYGHKTWAVEEAEYRDNYDIEVNVFADGILVHTEVIESEERQYDFIIGETGEMLPQYSKTGETIIYTMTETPVEGFVVEVSNGCEEDYCFAFTNTPKRYFYVINKHYISIVDGVEETKTENGNEEVRYDDDKNVKVDATEYQNYDGNNYEYTNGTVRIGEEGETTPIVETGLLDITLEEINKPYIIDLYYLRANEEAPIYTVTVNYYINGTETVLREKHVDQGSALEIYNKVNESNVSISGYTRVRVEGDAVSGVLDGDKVINVYYNRSGGDTNPPIKPKPPIKPEPPIIIEEPEVPLGNLPELPVTEPVVEVIIIDENVPLGNLPKTGTTQSNQLGIGILGFVILGTLELLRKRKTSK